MWADPEFTQLTREAQHLYFFLWTQPSVNSGGFLDLHVTKWAKASVYLTPEDVEATLDELIVRGWVMVDDATDELWLCRWIPEDAINSPLIWVGALKAIRVASSRTLRHAAYKEVCGLPRPEVRPEADGLLSKMDEAFKLLADLVEREGGKPFPNPFQTLSKPKGEGAGEGEGEVPPPRAQKPALCERCHQHRVMERGLCGACLGRELGR